MAASSWPSPASLELHSAVSLQCQLLVSEQRSFPTGDGREGVCKAVKRRDQQSASDGKRWPGRRKDGVRVGEDRPSGAKVNAVMDGKAETELGI